ncbi:MAG TPA: hypothetical protein VMI53_08275 [Opitutaceae bacterium]|nr:hypothetical protein [Opitutaceae bacterium]
MTETDLQAIFEKLDQFRRELVDLAFTLECRGRFDAADVAMTTSARMAELCDEVAAAKPSGA